MKKRFSDKQFISILRKAEAGVPPRETCHKHAISDATIHTWRKKSGDMEASEETDATMRPVVRMAKPATGCHLSHSVP